MYVKRSDYEKVVQMVLKPEAEQSRRYADELNGLLFEGYKPVGIAEVAGEVHRHVVDYQRRNPKSSYEGALMAVLADNPDLRSRYERGF